MPPPHQISLVLRRNAGCCFDRTLPLLRLSPWQRSPTVRSCCRRSFAICQGPRSPAGLLLNHQHRRRLHGTGRSGTPADEMTLSNGLPRSKACRAQATAHLKEVITPELLERLRRFWFKHLHTEEAFILPQKNQLGRWFFADADFDAARKFRSALEAMKSSRATTKDIIAIARPITPLQWLSLVILLDQVPRNCYRGAESATVFNFFDPLARDIANHAIQAGATTHDRTRYRVAYRMWFYLPLMHSEDLALHDAALRHYGRMRDEFEELMAEDGTVGDDDRRKCWGVLAVQKETARDLLETNYDFEVKHRDIIAQFGRYPHRNYALHRQSTAEEKEYLKNGGETFSNIEEDEGK